MGSARGTRSRTIGEPPARTPRAPGDRPRSGRLPTGCVATPGAGKTTFALTCARQVLADLRCRLVVVAPTSHLKYQWTQAAHRLGLELDPDWAPGQGLARDVHGLVTTYQQVATGEAAQQLSGLAAGAMVVLDEIHHAGAERAWGDAVRVAFGSSARRLCLSGTPFRSDTAAIPFVRYEDDEAVADFEYGYTEALRDGGVVRPVYFPRIDGVMEWSAPDGAVLSATFQDELDRRATAQRLRTALSGDGEWLPAVLAQAHERLDAIRRDHADAGGLVIASDQEHAHEIAGLIRRRLAVPVEVVVSEDPTASKRLTAFAGSDLPWLVAVRMVSEGVDIPRLRVGVYATTTSTELFFRQAVGRFVRWQSGRRSQKAYVFLPDDPRLRTHAFQIAEARRHALRPPAEEGDDGDKLDEPTVSAEPEPQEAEQLSLFAVLSSVPTEAGPSPWGRRSVAEVKEELRATNAELAQRLVDLTGWGHARVHAELNRTSGVASVATATVEQLQRRQRRAQTWLDGLRGNRRGIRR